VPLVIYCTQGIDRLPAWIRRVAVATYLVLFTALGAYSALAAGAVSRGTGVEPAMHLRQSVWAFVSLGLLCGFDFDARRWMAYIARTNIVAAIVRCLGLLGFLTPVADIQRLAVSFHTRHVAAANGVIEPDWKYLSWRSGQFHLNDARVVRPESNSPTC
jgi:hypothetical protein